MTIENISRLAKIRSRLEAATPGPWRMTEPRSEEDCKIDHGWSHAPCNDIESATATSKPSRRELNEGEAPYPESVITSWGHDADGVIAKLADLDFIANSRDDIEYLLDLIEEP